MKPTSTLLRILLAALVIGGAAFAPLQDETELKSSDYRKLTKPLGEWVAAVIQDDSETALEARADLEKAAAGIQKKLRDTDLLSLVADWEIVLEEGRDYETSGLKKGRVDVRDIGDGNTFALWIPKNYNPKKAGHPLLLLMTDLAGDPSERIEALPDAVRDEAIVLAPDLRNLSKEETLKSAGRVRLLRPLGIVTRDFRVDRNRLLLLGEGSSAGPAARYAALLPHFFAGVAVTGGNPEPGSAKPNLDLVASTKTSDQAGAAEWLMAQKPRQAYPAEFEFTLTEPWAGRAFWIQAMRFDPEQEGSGAGKLSTLKVKVDRATNTIQLDAEGVYQVDLFLNDRIVDLGKPLHIVRNGVDYEYEAARSLGTLLQNFRMTLDSGAVYTTVIRRVELPPRE